MIGSETVKMEDLSKIPIFLKAVGVKVSGAFVGIKKTEFGNVDIFLIRIKDACYGRVGPLGEVMVAMPGDVVGFTLSVSAKSDFWRGEVKEGDVVSLTVHGQIDHGDGRITWDETFAKVSSASKPECGQRYFVDAGASGYDVVCPLPQGHPPTGKCSGPWKDDVATIGEKTRILTSIEGGQRCFVGDDSKFSLPLDHPPSATEVGRSSRSWSDIVTSAKSAYASTGGDFRDRMLLLAGSLIDFDADRDVVRLVEQARAAKKAYDDEYVQHGCWKVDGDGESNYTRWMKASLALAKAMLDEKL
jgi:hypothetical protein